MKPRIRIDDVLQSTNFSYWQKESMKIMPMFNWFKLATMRYEDYPLILAVVAEGIDSQPEWVTYIKMHPKWEVQCHGWEHKTYTYTEKERIKWELKDAKTKIEETFRTPVTKFYPPKMKYNDITQEMARQVGLEEARERFTIHHYFHGECDDANEFYIHYWNPVHIEELWRVTAENSLIES